MLLTNCSVQQFTAGKITNIMSTDSTRLEFLFYYGFYLWSAPLQVLISCVFLVFYMGWSSMAGAATLLALIPVQALITKWLNNLTAETIKKTDMRLELTTEMLRGIRILKYYAWEGAYHDRLDAIREQELHMLLKRALMQTVQATIVTLSPLIVTLVSFWVYTLVSPTPLTAAQAFTGLTLFGLLRMPLYMIPSTVTMLVEANISLGRLGELLALEEVRLPEALRISTDPEIAAARAASFDAGYAGWPDAQGGSEGGPLAPTRASAPTTSRAGPAARGRG